MKLLQVEPWLDHPYEGHRALCTWKSVLKKAPNPDTALQLIQSFSHSSQNILLDLSSMLVISSDRASHGL